MKKEDLLFSTDYRIKNGGPEAIRTPDLRLRRPSLYPAELRARMSMQHCTMLPLSWQ